MQRDAHVVQQRGQHQRQLREGPGGQLRGQRREKGLLLLLQQPALYQQPDHAGYAHQRRGVQARQQRSEGAQQPLQEGGEHVGVQEEGAAVERADVLAERVLVGGRRQQRGEHRRGLLVHRGLPGGLQGGRLAQHLLQHAAQRAVRLAARGQLAVDLVEQLQQREERGAGLLELRRVRGDEGHHAGEHHLPARRHALAQHGLQALRVARVQRPVLDEELIEDEVVRAEQQVAL